MVKIQIRISRKKYKRNQPAYEYKQHLILIPMSKNNQIELFLQQKLDIELSVNENTLNLKLKKQKSKGFENGKN